MRALCDDQQPYNMHTCFFRVQGVLLLLRYLDLFLQLVVRLHGVLRRLQQLPDLLLQLFGLLLLLLFKDERVRQVAVESLDLLVFTGYLALHSHQLILQL